MFYKKIICTFFLNPLNHLGATFNSLFNKNSSVSFSDLGSSKPAKVRFKPNKIICIRDISNETKKTTVKLRLVFLQ